MKMEWISVKEAADLMGYSERYFRATWCDPDHPLVLIRDNGQQGPGRRIWIYRPSVEQFIKGQHRVPA